MIQVNQVRLRPGHSAGELRRKTAEILHVRERDIQALSVVRRSVDARKKPDIFYSYTVGVELADEAGICRRLKNSQVSLTKPERYSFPATGKKELTHRPVIIGAGPAGLFCGYFLALHGYRPILLERGKDVDARGRDVEEFWREGRLRPDSNVQFGEGGAGTFSDGKLNTLVKDRSGRSRAVLELFVKAGAGEGILYDAKPHIGTDVLRGVVKNIRREIERLGGEVRFGCRMTELLSDGARLSGLVLGGGERLDCRLAVLAVGHSARDTFEMLYEKGIPMESKAFAVGLRVEHSQGMINESQYGKTDPGELGAAAYKVAAQTASGRGVYSFCMCPGGYVVNASSEPGRLAVNGMSCSARDGRNANSAVIVTVTPEDFGSARPLAGIAFQRELEERAYRLGQGKIPVQRYDVFKKRVELGAETPIPDDDIGTVESDSADKSPLQPAVCGAYVYADVSAILPQECNEAFVEGMTRFGRQIPGFDGGDTLLSGVESRTSSPVRINRGENLQSAVRGLYPCGEGAGYAGGIMSAAMDGMRVAEAIAAEYAPFGGR